MGERTDVLVILACTCPDPYSVGDNLLVLCCSAVYCDLFFSH